MKKALLILLVLQGTISYAQEFSITDQGNKWGIRYYDEYCGNQDPNDPDYVECEYTGVSVARINGEAVFNNITYAFIEGSSFGDLFIREEEGIVYQYAGDEEEIILYNFTLEVGDVVPLGSDVGCITDENNNNLADVIDVSTQFIAGYDRKVITFDIGYGSNFSNNVQWIEGIGSANDATNPDFLLCDLIFVLDCFNNGEEIFSFSQFEEECNALLNLSENSKITTSLTPNPIAEQATLTINTFLPNTTIIFYNLLGQRINQKELTSNTTMIDRSDFPSSGMYFYQIQNEGKILDAQKFIVK